MLGSSRAYSWLQRAALPVPGAADWPRFGCDLHNTRFNPNEKTIGPRNVERLKEKWRFDTDENWVIQQTPAVVGDTVFFGSGRYQYAVDSATGKAKWKYNWGADGEWERTVWQGTLKNRGTRSSPQYANGRIYFGTGTCSVFCVDVATGTKVWKTRLLDDERLERMEGQIFYSPVLYQDKVFIAYSGGDATLYCLDADTGAIRWEFRIAQDVPREFRTGGGSLWTSGAIDEKNNVIYNVTGSNKAFMPNLNLYSESIIAHDINTGELLWYYQAHAQDSFDLDFCAHPMVFDAVAPARIRGDVRPCVAAGNKAGIYCWNRNTGELYWKVMLGEASSSSGPLIDAIATAYNKVYVQYASPTSSPAMAVSAALNAYNGDIEWVRPNADMNSAPLAVANDVLYQGLVNGDFEALDAQSGRKLWGYKFPSSFRGGAAIANGAVYAGNGEPTSWGGEKLPYQHSLYCFTLDGK
jgi:glucose dehydrogenase